MSTQTKIKTQRKLNIISYNLKYHKASKELSGLVNRYKTDVLCIQECYSEQLPNRLGDLILAEKTRFNRLGLAIYYRAERFSLRQTKSYPLKKSVYDRLFSPAEERLLVTKLFDHASRQEFLVGSFHATHIIATNRVRRHQIKTAHNTLKLLSGNSPAIMVGDYNYPLFKKGLKIFIERNGYNLTLSDKPTYYLSKMIRSHLDWATSVNTQIERVKTLPKGISDHAPILVQAVIDRRAVIQTRD
ncbi:MAG TPA: endonuclease/exonuclease/phosphatase family protein [Candidatus Saccharimonadales bacterium]|nr:endonuclease/exonuclease/phosphatase family protein [Candidatus Saccharimonadales bacterium]